MRIVAQVSVTAAVIATPIVAISWSIIWVLAGLVIAVRNGGPWDKFSMPSMLERQQD
jgi:hypothetical protein